MSNSETMATGHLSLLQKFYICGRSKTFVGSSVRQQFHSYVRFNMVSNMANMTTSLCTS